jgi:hypothetical protein
MLSKTEEWEALYERLLETLREYGKNFSFDEEVDYFAIDDEYGDRHHKIEVVNPDFWSDNIQQRIREILVTAFPDWGVFVVFDGKAGGRDGFIIYTDHVEFGPPAPAANSN